MLNYQCKPAPSTRQRCVFQRTSEFRRQVFTCHLTSLTSPWPGAEAVVLYEETCAELGWEPDAARLEAMRAASAAGLAALEEKAKDAAENLGDVEVRDALAAKAEHLCRIGALFCVYAGVRA